MSDITAYAHGDFCWADLGTTDLAGAKEFYSKLFGWTIEDQPMGESGVYAMFKKDGKTVCAVYEQRAEDRAQGIPPSWAVYINVNNIDDAAARVVALGGKLLMPPFDVFEAGRMTYIQDPDGAIVALWQAKNHIGTQIKDVVGSLGWFEMMANDLPKARAFYEQLVGWNTTDTDMGGGKMYTMCNNHDVAIAGIMGIEKEWGPMPSHWSHYFYVENVVATVKQATDMGASIVVPVTRIPNVGMFARLRDPQGATFSVLDANK